MVEQKSDCLVDRRRVYQMVIVEHQHAVLLQGPTSFSK
jgi:hypothetical protein